MSPRMTPEPSIECVAIMAELAIWLTDHGAIDVFVGRGLDDDEVVIQWRAGAGHCLVDHRIPLGSESELETWKQCASTIGIDFDRSKKELS